VVFSGSLDLFSNEFAAATIGGAASGNEAFAAALSEWNFGERGVLRARNLEHRVVGAAVANPEQYRVGDEVEFAIDIEEYEGGAWRPFTESDVQLEYWLLDPVVRRTMRHNGKGRYSLAFKVPESFGVYRYVIDYQKDAYSRLRVEKQVPAHPFRHDEFDRFVLAAYPYYAGAFSMLAGFFIFGIVFLYNKA
jgi:oligosaccharyltransferase complex subunit beta